MDDYEALDNGCWEYWSHAHELDWVTTEALINARIGLIDLYWVLLDALVLVNDDPDQKRNYLRRMRKAYRHVGTFTFALRNRKTRCDDFEPHLFDRNGVSWDRPYNEKGLPPKHPR